MPLRTKLFQIQQWGGGLNTSVDPALIPNTDLVVANNVIFDTKTSRRKRGGIELWDYVGTASTRSSSGTTRTLILDAADAGKFSVSDDISVFHSQFESFYDGKSFTVDTVTTTTNTDDTITYEATGSLTEGSTSVSPIRVGLNSSGTRLIGTHDFHRNAGGGSKVRVAFAVNSAGAFYSYNESGKRTTLTNAGTAVTSPTIANFETINEKLIIGIDGTTNTPKKYDPASSADVQDLGGTPPNFSILRQHLSRIFTNDKSAPDRLHYSSTANPEEWNGAGDSGAIDIGIGDGDPSGITGIYPTFKGELFIAKKTKLYRVSGFTPETFRVEQVSNGIGSVGNDSIAQVDQDDLLFASGRGFHSISATANFGDFSASFISNTIQSLFNDLVDLNRIRARYIPDLNSVAFAVSSTGTNNSELLFYNIVFKTWYRWPGIKPESLMLRIEGDRKRLYIGNADNRILQTQTKAFTDFGNVGIPLGVKTGIIYPDGQLYTIKAFKRLILLFRPKGSFTFTAKVKIDNFAEQVLTFSQGGEADLLGSSFVLGTSELGIDPVLAPNVKPIDGYGHGATLEIEQSGSGQDVEIYGFGFEFEDAGTAQENILTESA